jgi:type I restriction enzyme S subunit
MLSDFFQRYLSYAEVGTTRAKISIKILKELFVLLPQRPEQDEIVLRLTSAERALDDSQRELAKLSSLKTGLMQDLLTGKRRVTPFLAPEPTRAIIDA